MAITRSAVVKYTMLPGLFPRLVTLFTSGFGHIAFLVAQVYAGIGLLPRHHAYLNPRNIGRFGIRHVLIEAYGNLKFTRKNIDQVIIYFTIVIGLLLLAAQIVLYIIAIIAQEPAMAQLEDVVDVVTVNSKYNPGPSQDLVFMMLDRIFGMGNIFNSCVSTAVECLDHHGNPIPGETFPQPFHIALHAMLQFFSLGIFVVSVIVILYFVITLTAETAATGTPFGQRANKTWMPVRLILFFALLVPLNLNNANSAGLNAAQIITLWTAKWGSNFATNAWGRFNVTLTNAHADATFLGEKRSLIGKPNIPELGELVKFMFVVKTCKMAEEWTYEHKPEGVQAYLVRDPLTGIFKPGANVLDFRTTNFKQAREFSNNGNISIRFGVKGEAGKEADPAAGIDKEPGDPAFTTFRGNVDPVCGEIKLTLVSTGKNALGAISGASDVQEFYYKMINDLWTDPQIIQRAKCVLRKGMVPADVEECNQVPDKDFANSLVEKYQARLRNGLPPLIQRQYETGDWKVSDQLASKGWGGAAIWYNRVAQLNGEISSAILGIPQPSDYPKVMEAIAEQRMATDDNVNASSIFDPNLAEGQEPNYPRDVSKDKDIAVPLYKAYSFWQQGGLYASDDKKSSGNFLIDAINIVLGTSGIYEIRKNTDIHPLAQLSTIGRSMMEASMRNIGLGTLGEASSLMMDEGSSRTFAHMGGKMLSALGVSFIAISFMLFYILPFLPFLYFFFAVSAWIKAIFEAVVAMPLWALAHILHIDGEGMAGSASTGYFILLEIFLRPILILFGLILSISIFSNMVLVLNDVFDLVVANMSGFDRETEAAAGLTNSLVAYARAPIDEFFFTVLYVIICYMIGLSSFKMVDAIPEKIMRWIGDSGDAFQSGDSGLASEALEKTYRGVTILTTQAKGGALAALTGK